ncbi:hypothetical protein BT96DRAFT_918912 [Gymnopus androsaceus JB14]|uniref:Uncharacterized protein n=1 Tax=Gymnopus androsaceus JB14 TaxID=1447944 RepID=A0A6A4HVM2_9AGAR|nr:hypothetical protein BT96DRAFT_918912 [Gymnopus androsaceus JB14]
MYTYVYRTQASGVRSRDIYNHQRAEVPQELLFFWLGLSYLPSGEVSIVTRAPFALLVPILTVVVFRFSFYIASQTQTFSDIDYGTQRSILLNSGLDIAVAAYPDS